MRGRLARALPILLAVSLALSLLGANGVRPIWEPTTITESGVYLLTRDVAGPITIDAGNVLLDLGGWTVSAGNTTLIINHGHDNVTVRNGRLVGGQRGILLDEGTDTSEGIILENLAIESSSRGIDLDDAISGAVRNCKLRGGGGIRISGRGQPAAFQLVDNVVVDASSRGFDLYHLSGGALIRNHVVGAGPDPIGHGIHISSASPGGGNLIQENVVASFETADTSRSAFLVSSPDNTIRGNVVTDSQGIGLDVTSAGNRVEGNHVAGSVLDGIRISSMANDVFGNSAVFNGRFGLSLETSSIDNVYDRNRLCRNTVLNLSDNGANLPGASNIVCVQ